MKPALSVIFLTVLGGAGYGLWCFLGAALALGMYPYGRGSVLVPLGFGFVLVTAGLIASTLHLGRPERAWRALTQWDSSWLSREGLAALTTYLPVLLVAGLARGHNLFPPTRAAGAVLTACSLVTLVCTARIYTSLKPIRAWRDPHVLPLYLLFALLSGGLWLWTYLAFDTGSHPPWFPLVLALLGVAAAGMKIDYWRAIDRAPAVTAGEATGLDRFGRVRAFEGPATEESYLTREMAFVLARKHSRRLRVLAIVLFCAVPLAVIAIAWPLSWQWIAPVAALSCLAGLFVERWLFFAEARHAVAAFFPQRRPA